MPQILFMLYTTGAINQIYGMIFLGVLIIVVWQWMRKGRAYINGLSSQAMLTMVTFCFLYFAIGEHTIPGFLYYFVCPLLAYATGWVTVESGKNRPEEVVKYSVYFMLVHELCCPFSHNCWRPGMDWVNGNNLNICSCSRRYDYRRWRGIQSGVSCDISQKTKNSSIPDIITRHTSSFIYC